MSQFLLRIIHTFTLIIYIVKLIFEEMYSHINVWIIFKDNRTPMGWNVSYVS